MPSDLTGINFYNQKEGRFEFRPGPLFANIVLADEINRATPRSQSALLEVMEEKQVSIDGASYPMQEPYLVMATENPIEFAGTFEILYCIINLFWSASHFLFTFPAFDELLGKLINDASKDKDRV